MLSLFEGWFLLRISNLAYLLPVAVGIVCWKHLTKPLRIYWFWYVVASLSVLSSEYFGDSRIGFVIQYILLGLGQALVMGWFFTKLFQTSREKLMVWSIYTLLLFFQVYTFVAYGSDSIERIFMVNYATAAFFSFRLLRNEFSSDRDRYQKALFIVLLILFSEGVVSFVLYGFIELFIVNGMHYWYSIFYLRIMPFVNFTVIGTATYAFMLTWRQHGHFTRIPELES